MPPVWAFSARQRPSGLVFASCKRCNNGTKASDFAVGWFARLKPFNNPAADPLYEEATSRLATLESRCPGLRAEVFDQSPYEEIQVEHEGKMRDVIRVTANGPILARLLVTFGAKLGMALFREHMGYALPEKGAVFIQPFMNGGLTQATADTLLGILPNTSTLTQGRREVSDQFAYAWNCDERTIFMALASFQQNLHFMVLATTDPDFYWPTVSDRFVARVRPGELLDERDLTNFNPRPRPSVLPGLPQPKY